MKHKIMAILITIIVIVGVVSCQAETAAEPTVAPEINEAELTPDQILTLGDVSDDPLEKIAQFQPLADYMAANLAGHGISLGEVKIAPDLETMSQWLESGEVDLYFDSAYPAIVINETVGGRSILRRWKDGVAQYNTVIIVNLDSELNSLDDLPGHLFGFEDPQSTSGYFMPYSLLLDQELNLIEKSSDTSSVSEDEVGYLFTGDGNTVEWVRTGRVDAAAIQSTDFTELQDDVKSELRVLAETDPMPRHLVIVRPDMSTELEEAISELLIGIDETATGAEILRQFEETAQFDEIPQSALDFLEEIRGLYLQSQEG